MKQHLLFASALLTTLFPVVAQPPPDTCNNDVASSCLDCLTADCAFSWGACLTSCDLANNVGASCFVTDNYVGLTPREICEIAATEEDLWDDEPSTNPGRDEESEETTTTVTTTTTPLGGTAEIDPTCAAFPEGSGVTCSTCLTVGCVYAAGGGGQCLSSCRFIADAACYDAAAPQHAGTSLEDLCATAETMQFDAELCGGGKGKIVNCETCTNTVKSDGISPCAWYTWEGTDAGGYCGAGHCDWTGNCGSTTCHDDDEAVVVNENGSDSSLKTAEVEAACNADDLTDCVQICSEATCCFTNEIDKSCAVVSPDIRCQEYQACEVLYAEPCNAFSECEPCLNGRLECAWVEDSCHPTCNVGMADDPTAAPCYHSSTFPNMTGPEICWEAEFATANDNRTAPVAATEQGTGGDSGVDIIDITFDVHDTVANSQLQTASAAVSSYHQWLPTLLAGALLMAFSLGSTWGY